MARKADLNDIELQKVLKKAEQVNARAAKRGWTGRVEVTYTRVLRTWETLSGLTVEASLWDTEIAGRPAQYEGWTFLAALDWDWDASGDGEPLLVTRTAPGFDGRIDRAGLKPGGCDHCRATRNRRTTYLVQGQDGTRVQVGSTCIKDFLGHDVRFAFVSDDLIEEDEDGFGFGGGGEPSYTPLTVIGAAWAVMQMEGGYTPSSGGSEYHWPTKDIVKALLRPGAGSERTRDGRQTDTAKFAQGVRKSAVEAPGQAALILGYLLDDTRFPRDSDYADNLKALLATENITPRHFGLVCSAPQAWAKSVGAELRRQAKNADIVNEWFGAEKDKVELDVRIRSIAYSENNYGYRPTTTTIYTLLDTSTNRLVKWFSTSAALGHEAEREFRIKATVKGHDEWEGVKSTVITRAAVISEAKRAA